MNNTHSLAPSISALMLKAQDDVANLLQASCTAQEVIVTGCNDVALALRCLEDIPRFHKIALRDIDIGAAVVRDGYPIGRATHYIKAGNWVHIHNLQSSRAQSGNSLKERT